MNDPNRRIQQNYNLIEDNYHSIEQVTEALQKAGLESSNLIIGIDFTKSNEWTGKRSFNGKKLHDISGTQNPYEQAITLIGQTLSKYDEDNLIPCFGFGDANTHDKDVFSLSPDGRPCYGLGEVLTQYRQTVSQVRLSGPTSFAPIIEKAIDIVLRSGCLYHILLIIADGQVTACDGTNPGQSSYQEECTIGAIERASNFPLSIILVGVGDGPWDLAKKYDDSLPARLFDNFQFVNFTEIMSQNIPRERKEAEFAVKALMEVPLQLEAIQAHNLQEQNREHLTPPRTGGLSASR